MTLIWEAINRLWALIAYYSTPDNFLFLIVGSMLGALIILSILEYLNPKDKYRLRA